MPGEESALNYTLKITPSAATGELWDLPRSLVLWGASSLDSTTRGWGV